MQDWNLMMSEVFSTRMFFVEQTVIFDNYNIHSQTYMSYTHKHSFPIYLYAIHHNTNALHL